ncbi:Acetyltransferase (GNAT) family protein [Nocardiopsis flavescens]|uniref:Acetyltransferase (GNAT) family protein n=1 Tax=Nocardiopsis flavescens TaxID=758803 RepID=A0A1M6CBF8_9ACTN|nr:GNAT family N-acetyltransferase [Nocardiopsis flavescens]SHI58336.1 Acetyltransferase (GNAT) family protein [Nocardiopsis flavescens]
MTRTRTEGAAGATDTAGVRVHTVRHDDPRVRGLLDGLLEEYTERYGAEGAAAELSRYPISEFAAPHGRVVLAEIGGEVVAGGALRPYRPRGAERPDTAEFKRIWTSARHRRRGLGRTVMAALEDTARDLGYRGVILFTGPNQPEAVALYERIGYRWTDPAAIDDLPYPRAIPFERSL